MEAREHTLGKDCWCNPEVIKVSGKNDEIGHRVSELVPESVEVNVVMGAQLRAIVRSALIHVRNRLKDVPVLESTKQACILLVDEELAKWPLGGEAEKPDTLAQWLFKRFGQKLPDDLEPYAFNWEGLHEVDRVWWEHEADAVRRAVGRGGFKTSPDEVEISTPISDLHQAHANSGNMVKGYRQLDLKYAETLGEAIRIAIGAASVTWTNMSGAGIFKSEVALDISTQLEHHIMAFLNTSLGQIGERHQELFDHLKKYHDAGQPMVSVKQVMEILTGRTTPVEYDSAMQRSPEVGHG
jgi:hypothetical protein